MAQLLSTAEYDRRLTRFLADRGPMPPQSVTCYDCGTTWTGLPSRFIYDDPGSGWRQDPLNQEVGGHCRPCADEIEASRDIYGGRGTERIEQRDIEDEMFIWDR
jgi:hypothetical protein